MANKKTKTSKKALDLVGYEGNVHLRVVKNNVTVKELKIHNLGTTRLFKGIALALLGASSADLVGFIPKYLGVGYENPLTDTSVSDTELHGYGLNSHSPRVSVVPLNVREYLEENTLVGYVAPFQAVIPSSIVSILGSSQKLNEIGLFGTSETGTLLARIKLPTEVEIPSGSSLIVQWDIIIRNYPQENQ